MMIRTRSMVGHFRVAVQGRKRPRAWTNYPPSSSSGVPSTGLSAFDVFIQDATRIKPATNIVSRSFASNRNGKLGKRNRTTEEALRSHTLQANTMRQQIESVGPLNDMWEYHEEVEEADADRINIWRQAVQMIQHLKTDVHNGLLQPQSKHRSEMSIFLDWILRSLAVAKQGDDDLSEVTIYDLCLDVRQLMADWNIDLQHSHSHSIMLVAAREGRWKEATKLFVDRIDPGAAGFNPMDISISNPVSLYCVARYAQERNVSAAESVLNAVLRMAIICPTDQGKYTLAAGNALGLAGEADDFLKCLKKKTYEDKLGQPLVAAGMQACLICNRPEDALVLFDDLTGGDFEASVEWQWEGGSERLLPVCRDLAIRALGFSNSTIDTTDEVLQFFNQAEERDLTLSYDAFLAILQSCEKDGDWERAVKFLFYVLSKHNRQPCLVDGSSLEIPLLENASEYSRAYEYESFVEALEVTMRACNASGRYGVALLCVQRFLVDLGINVKAEDRTSHMIRSVNTLAEYAPNPEHFSSTAMASFLGANAHDCVKELIHMPTDRRNATVEHLKEINSNTPDHAEMWSQFIESSYFLLQLNERKEKSLSSSDRQMASFVLAKTINLASAGNDPWAGQYLVHWLTRKMAKNALAQQPSVDLIECHRNIIGKNTIFERKDSLTAAMLRSNNLTGDFETSIRLFNLSTRDGINPGEMLLSGIETIRALFASGSDKTVSLKLLSDILATSRNPDLFCSAAEGLLLQGDYESFQSVYKDAVSVGCNSEALGIMALKVARLVEADWTVKNEILNQAVPSVGDSKVKWLRDNYWDIKEILGFKVMRPLLTWDDPSTAPFDELNLALQEVEQQSWQNPHPEALKLIVAAAGVEDNIPPMDRDDLRFVPRSKEAWAGKLQKAIKASLKTALRDDSHFLEKTALALMHIGLFAEAGHLVTSALSRGMYFDQEIIEEVNKMIQSTADY